MRRAAAVILSLALGAACGSPGRPDAAEGRGTERTPVSTRAGTGETFTPAQRATMETAWAAFKRNSPGWPVLRDRWIELGEKPTNVLVENLLRAMVLSRLGNYPEGFDRARKELILLGAKAVPTVAGALERGVWYSAAEKREVPLPAGVVVDLTELLAIAGSPSVPWLADLCSHRQATIRRAAAKALGQIGDPEGLEAVFRMLAGGGDWADRMAAANALGYSRSARAVDPLIRALRDPDSSVVQEAARSLARLGAREAIPALETRREEARAEGNHKVAAACGAAAQVLRGGR